MGITPLISIPASDIPLGPVRINLARATLEPGTDAPVSTYAYPEIAYVEAGTLICPGAAGRYIIAADGTVREVGDEDVTVNTGEAIYVPANVADGARNDGTEQLVVLIIDLVPDEGMATPMA
jgi:hypothetical protein